MSREEILAYFEELCGPHLDPDIYTRTDEDLAESYVNSLSSNH